MPSPFECRLVRYVVLIVDTARTANVASCLCVVKMWRRQLDILLDIAASRLCKVRGNSQDVIGIQADIIDMTLPSRLVCTLTSPSLRRAMIMIKVQCHDSHLYAA